MKVDVGILDTKVDGNVQQHQNNGKYGANNGNQ